MPLRDIDVLNAIPLETPPEHVVRLTEIATALNKEATDLQSDLAEAGRDLRVANNSKGRWRVGAIFAGLFALVAVAATFLMWPKHNDEQYALMARQAAEATSQAEDLRGQLAACVAKPAPVCTPSQGGGGVQSGADSPGHQYNIGKDMGTLLERTEQINRKVEPRQAPALSQRRTSDGGSGSSTTPRQPQATPPASIPDGGCIATLNGTARKNGAIIPKDGVIETIHNRDLVKKYPDALDSNGQHAAACKAWKASIARAMGGTPNDDDRRQ
jgi:hypothetical protein